MTSAATVSNALRDLYAQEFVRIREQFETTGDGSEAVRQRTALLDNIILRLWKDLISPDAQGPTGFAVIALGGYGRAHLFPYSDVDLLFLHDGSGTEQSHETPIRQFSQTLWDLRLKFSPATRTLPECDQFDFNNVEFAISLLDCRYLAGDRSVYIRLRNEVIPKLVTRESQPLVQRLVEVTRARHSKFGNTIFHLEPNIKDGPGGLRDYNVACWMSLISAMDKTREWPDSTELLPLTSRKPFDAALRWLISVRCFLHFYHGRGDETLSWDAQDKAALRNIGGEDGVTTAADWMRAHFRFTRPVHRTCTQLLDEVPATWSSLYRQFQRWRSRLSNSDFSVVHGLVFLQEPKALQDRQLLFRLFEFIARHGLKLSTSAEQQVEQQLPALAANPPHGAELWGYLRDILKQPNAADALRAMRSLNLLTIVVPELRVIDALVVRDFYHRFTVDEHSFVAIESLHQLRQTQAEWDQRFTGPLNELDQPELLYLALLLHDTGKGVTQDEHIPASLQLAEQCMERLDLAADDRDTVRFLIANHLEMSAALRRDIFDSATVATFAEKVKTPARLKLLCLFTYADIKAVNPEALTPWKAENLFQLYIATSNYLNRNADERLRTDEEEDYIAHVPRLAPASKQTLKEFLDGLPRRYLASYRVQDVLRHFEMTENVANDPVQLHLERGRHWYELTVVTVDRPALFASVAGALTAWGMSIVKANAFSNHAGTIVDTFYFTDRFGTLELNLPEWERFKRSVADILTGKADLERMLRDRQRSDKSKINSVVVPTRVDFDDASSTRSTLLQVIAKDRPGLLHALSRRISDEKCNIELALIDTEGQTAVDVFYITSSGKKLRGAQQKRLHAALLEELEQVSQTA
ncbi:MAG TPA: [protein-PII] uridylyltransferase [Terriglobales bacterium]|nr:[protein-PII] uridylyltransferase [Terriglobales bacterium]